MQKRRGDGRGVEAELREDRGRLLGVLDVRPAGLARLPFVRAHGERVRLLDEVDVESRVAFDRASLEYGALSHRITRG